LLQGSALSPIPGASLVVEDGIITEIRSEIVPGSFDMVEDFHDCVVMPGFIDTHVHLQLLPGTDHEQGKAVYEQARQAGGLALRAMKQARLALSAGITTVRDLGGDMSILALRDAISLGEPGPRLIAAGLPITTGAGHCHWMGDLRADNAEEVRKVARWLIERGVDVVKIMASGGNMTAGSNALQPQYSAEELSVAVREAHRLGRRVVAHALNVEAIRNCIQAGVDSIDHCSWQLPDSTLAYDPDLGQLLVQSGTRVGITGSGILRILLGRGEPGRAELRRVLDAHRQLFHAGARVGVHSDAGVRFTPIERFDLTLKVMMVGLDLSPREALVGATSTAAEALGLEAELGSVAPGMRADLVVLEANPLDDLDNVRTIRAVYRDGTKLIEQGRLFVPSRPEASDPWTWIREFS
jgi:imidazolonepropionase-like amidohydrolase